MTTIDHQQAAIDAAAGEIAPHAYDKELWRCTLADGRSMEQTASDAKDTAEAALTAAAPHLRAAWGQELARAVKRLPWNGVTHGGTMVPLDAVLALLEGGGEDK